MIMNKKRTPNDTFVPIDVRIFIKSICAVLLDILRRKKFAVDAEAEDEKNYNRKNIGEISSHPILYLHSLTRIRFCLEIVPAPAVT